MRYTYAAAAMMAVGSMTGIASGDAQDPPKDPRFHDLPNTNTNYQPASYTTLPEWTARREWLREQARFAAGLIPEPQRTPLNAHVFDKYEGDGFTVEKVYFESRPGLYVTGNLYRPVGVEGKRPAVACPHGHWQHGRLHHDELGSIPARCIMLARLGAVVFAYDMLAYNDSGRQFEQHKDDRWTTPVNEMWGIGPLQVQTWNSIRVLDFLQSLPDVDGERIGVTGASGGGTQTFILSAIDDRVKVAAPVNMISHTMQGGCMCENAPALRIDTNNMEIGALFAPKPLLMISATGDWTKDTPEVEYPFIRSIYTFYGAADPVKNVHVDAPHNYNKQSREAMYRFFAKHLLRRDDADTLTEPDITPPPNDALLVFNDGNMPKDMPRFEELIARMKQSARKRMAELRPDSKENLVSLMVVVHAALAHAIGSTFPQAAEIEVQRGVGGINGQGGTSRLTLVRKGRRVDASLCFGIDDAPARARLTVFPTAGGLSDISDLPWKALPLGTSDFLLTAPFGTPQEEADGNEESERGKTMFFTTFNRTDSAETVFDLLTALSVALSDEKRRQVDLLAGGDMGPPSLIARAMVPRELATKKKLRTVIDLNRFDATSESAYAERLHLPSLLKVGGLEAVAAAACSGPLWLHNVGEHFDGKWARAAAKITGVQVRIDKDKADPADIAAWLAEGE